MLVAEVLNAKPVRGVISISAHQSMADLVDMLAERRIGAVVVTDANGALCGVISERDIVRCLAADGATALSDPVVSHMTREVKTASISDDVVSVLERMTEGRFRHMPVIEDDEIVGVVSIGDIVKHRMAALQRDNAALEAFIQR